jgi:molecular chaperone HscB
VTPSAGQAVNYFEVFGLSARFDLDSDDLRRRYFAISRQTHPDRPAHGSSEVEGLRRSATANRAYEVLSAPVARAEHLLELAGGPSASEERTVPEETLNQALRVREEIEDLRASSDLNQLDEIRRQVEARNDALLGEVSRLARGLPGDDTLRQELRLALNSIRYYQRMLEQCG